MKLRILSFLLLLAMVTSLLCGCVSTLSFERPTEDVGSTQEAGEGSTKRPTGSNGQTTGAPHSTTGGSPSQGETSVPSDSSFAVHFIDVGQADSILVLCDGKSMLIDGGNVGDSNLVYSYLQKRGITHLDYVVCTHAHEDHVGGLSGALSYATAGVVYSPVTSYTTKAFSNFVKKVEEQGKTLTVPRAGTSFSLGEATVHILGPLKEYDDPNNTSIVLRVVYGELSFLFTGDMETDAEKDLLDAGVELRSTVLKLGHHGSSTSTSYRFLREVAPTYGVITVGTDNDYGHPHDEVLSRLRDAEVKLYRTDLQGDVICTSQDGKTLTFTTVKNQNAVTNPTEGDQDTSEDSYIGNLKSKVYHRPSCHSLPAESNRIIFSSKEEADQAGYRSCGSCKP